MEEGREAGLKELGVELQSLKALVVGRLGSGGSTGGGGVPGAAPSGSGKEGSSATGANMFGVNGTVGTSSAMEGLKRGGSEGATKSVDPPRTATVTRSDVGSAGVGSRSGTASPYPSYAPSGRKGGIPEWQLAAAKKADVQPKVENATEDGEQASVSKTM